MIRHVLLFAIFFYSTASLYAQPTIIQAMMPKIGDAYMLYDCDTTGVVPGNSGANISWDFSSLTRLSGSEYMTTVEFIAPSFGPQSDKFPLATIAQVNDTGAVYYRETSAGYFRLGVGAFELYEVVNPQDQYLKFPFNYGEKLTADFRATIYIESEDMEVERYGETSTEYDGYGSLKMPFGDYNNVYRLYYHSVIFDTVNMIPGFPPIIIRTETKNYSWHASTSIQPILTISHINITYTGFPATPVNIKTVTYSEFGGSSMPLLPPTLVSPANNSVDIEIPVLLTWEAPLANNVKKDRDEFQAEEEIQYHLQLSSNPGFSALEFDANVTTTSQEINELEIGTTYFWRVRSIKGEEVSEFSPIWNFKTKVPDDIEVPDPPMLISPENGSIVESKKPNLVWEEGAGVDYTWKIEVAQDQNFEEIIFSETPRMTNTFEFDYELEAGNYFWRVAVNNGEAWSEWSETWYFIIEGVTIVLDPPVLLEPADGSNDLQFNSITFKWEEDENAAYWIIQVAEDENFDLTFAIDETETNEITITDFDEYFTYYWRVMAINNDSFSEWSNTWSFTTMQGGSVKNIFGGDMLKIMPNPAQEYVQIKLQIENSQSTTIEIRDVLGNLVISENLGMMESGHLDFELSIANFAIGQYFAIVRTGDTAYINIFNVTR